MADDKDKNKDKKDKSFMENAEGFLSSYTESKQAICGVELIIKNSDPVITTVTNEAGYFQFENIPQGRFYVQASYADYKCQPISKVDIFPGKSKVLCIELASNEYQKRNKSNLKTKIKELITGLP